ncbi:DNA-binding IclR family transcriptional regulator [Streptomyces sp. PvR034]
MSPHGEHADPAELPGPAELPVRGAGDRGEHARTLEHFLARARVPDRYPHYDLGAAETRLLLRARAAARAADARARPGPPGWSDPARDRPVEAEQARRDLKAVSLAVVCGPGAAARLGEFIATRHGDPPGALVFGCLLHLAGLRDGARFWWQFAAGSGAAHTGSAAYCLFLDHSRRGEHQDARVWAAELARSGYLPGGPRDLREIRLCAQARVLRHVDQFEDVDLGPVPLPRPGLPEVLPAFLPTAPAREPDPAAGSDPRPSPRARAEGDPAPLPLPVRRPPPPAARVRGPGPADPDATGALARARRALAVVGVLERHPLGVDAARIGREAGLVAAELGPVLAMLCEEGYACRPAAGVYGRGPALDRLGAPGGHGLAAQLQHTLALARDSAGAAFYLSRYAEGEVRITQMAEGPGTPPVDEWVDFRAAAHASAVGKCLLTQLDRDGRADHVARHRPARLTARTITDSRVLFHALDALAPGEPVFDLSEYAPGVVCSAVALATGGAASSLALSLPAGHAHRLGAATATLRRKAVPVLLALLLSGAIPPDGAAVRVEPDSPARTLRHLRSVFRTPHTRATASPGPHLVSDPASEAAYLFAASPRARGGDGPALALPRTFAPLPPLGPGGDLVVLHT